MPGVVQAYGYERDHSRRSVKLQDRVTKLSGAPIEILLVEDNPADVCLVQESFAGGKVLNNLHVVCDGAEAIAFLHRNGHYANAPRPDLILLDLHLPKKNGFAVLADVKGEKCLKTIPVVVLTSSRTDLDVLKSYELQANCYIEKPVNLEKLLKVVKAIEEFWLEIACLPLK